MNGEVRIVREEELCKKNVSRGGRSAMEVRVSR